MATDHQLTQIFIQRVFVHFFYQNRNVRINFSKNTKSKISENPFRFESSFPMRTSKRTEEQTKNKQTDKRTDKRTTERTKG